MKIDRSVLLGSAIAALIVSIAISPNPAAITILMASYVLLTLAIAIENKK